MEVPLEEQLKIAKELVEKAITDINLYNQTLSLHPQSTALDKQSKKYAENYDTVIETCNHNSGDRQMVVLCDKLKLVV